jgi:hypothetical protein
MIFITDYTFNSAMGKQQTRELMAAFAEFGSAPGTIAHYVNSDGSGGTVIAESDDPAAGYRNALEYSEWLDMNTRVVLTVDDAVPHIADYMG